MSRQAAIEDAELDDVEDIDEEAVDEAARDEEATEAVASDELSRHRRRSSETASLTENGKTSMSNDDRKGTGPRAVRRNSRSNRPA